MRPAISSASLALTLLLLAGAGGAASGPWFDEIVAPVALGEAHGTALCRLAWTELRGGRSALGGADPGGSVRAVILSWSDGTGPASVAHGLGNGPLQALRAALRRIPPQRLPRERLRWLKVDVVQSAAMVPPADRSREQSAAEEERLAEIGYLTRESVLPLPSLLGIAFSPSSQFAILPDQLLGMDMLDPMNRLLADPYSAWLEREGRTAEMGTWNLVATLPVPQRICLFETQAWFTENGQDVAPLYRGHRLYEDVGREEILGLVGTTARRLAGLVDGEGREAPPFARWIGPEDGAIEPFDAALTALALARAAHLVPDNETALAAAERLARSLVARLQPVGGGSQGLCLVEEDGKRDERGHLDATWHTVRLGTNALCVLALCALAEHGDAERFDAPLAGLARYILDQRQADGVFVAQRLWPGGKLAEVLDQTASALAVCALQAIYEKTELPAFRVAAVEGFEALLPLIAAKPMDELDQDEWFLRAADRGFTYSWDERYIQQAQRVALAAVSEQVREPLFADYFGNVPGRPSATAAATRTGLIAVAARLVHDGGRRAAARQMMLEARPSVLAQLQGRITAPEAMYLDEPRAYLGFFRDHVQGFGFDLQCQYGQLLSLIELAKTMEHLRLEGLRDDNSSVSRQVDEQLRAARRLAERYPHVLGVFDGKLARHHIAMPERSLEERDGSPILPRAVPPRRGEPAIRPVPPRR